jgi:hypothetical protein
VAKCPNCGAEVVNPVKSWNMIGKPDRSGEMFKLTMGLYNCICSEKSFRSVIGKEKITLKGVIEKNNSLEEQLMEATSKKSELESIVKALEDEKSQLLAEVEALRAIPVLEEKVTSLEADLIMLRAEKGALMFKLTKLATEAPSAAQLAPVEKPLEDYISEAVNAEEISPIKESVSGCPSAEIEVPGTVTEAPTRDATSTEMLSPDNLPLEPVIEKQPSDVTQVEAAPIDVPRVEVPVSNSDVSIDMVSPAVQPENPIEIVVNVVQPIESSPADVRPIIEVEVSQQNAVSVGVKQVEMQIPERPLVVDVAEATSDDSVSVPVSPNEPYVTAPIMEETSIDASPANVQVETTVEQELKTSPTLTDQVETTNIITEKIEENPTEFSSDPMIEATPVDVSPDEITQTVLPASVEEKPAETSLPVINVPDVLSIEIIPSEENSTLPLTAIVASVETLDEEIAEMAQEIEEDNSAEAIVSESAPVSTSESVQITSFEDVSPEVPAQEPPESTNVKAVEPQTAETPKIEALVIEVLIDPIAGKPVELVPTSLDDVKTTTKLSETSKSVEEKQVPLFVI